MTHDPVCALHGLKRSEHQCLYCCLCFTSLTLDQCNILPGNEIVREDVCFLCAAKQAQRTLWYQTKSVHVNSPS